MTARRALLRGIAFTLLALSPATASSPASTGTAEATSAAPTTCWPCATSKAERIVAAETPSDRLAIRPARARVAGRVVLAHYIPSLPLSFDNRAAGADLYSRRLPTGAESHAKLMARFGSWERPLPVGPWPPASATAINAAIDVARARRIGVDGFVVDLFGLARNRNWDAATTLLDAAAAAGGGFGVAPAPNMQIMRDTSVAELADALAVFARHPGGFREPDGRLLVVPFMAEQRPVAFWRAVAAEMARRGLPIALIAQTLAADAAPAYAPVSVGLSFWGGRDPASAGPQAAVAARFAKATGRPVMMPVAPQDFRPKASMFWEARNTEAFRRQWEAAIAVRAPWVHLITWNDYSEGTEVSPSSSIQYLFYDLCAYYIAWYKSGRPPPIEREAILYAFRRQVFNPAAPALEPSYRHTGATPLANEIELVAVLRRPATLRITLAGTTRTVNVPAGIQTLRLPARAGTPCFTIERGGRAAIRLVAPVMIEAQPRFGDALYGGGSSLRHYVPTVAVALAADGRTPLPPQPAWPLSGGGGC